MTFAASELSERTVARNAGDCYSSIMAMPWRTKLVLLATVGAFVASSGSCGGKAVVDDGVGGGGASTSSSSGGPICVTDEPQGQLYDCGGTGSSSSGGTPQCSSSLCDQDGNIWESSCQGTACVCKFNFLTACSCVIEGGQLCAGSIPSCCPAPFPK